MSYKQSTTELNKLRSEYEQNIEKIVMFRCREVMAVFKHKYPKRCIKLVAGNGVVFFTIDNNILHYEAGCRPSLDGWYYINASGKVRELLSMLFDFLDWYREFVLIGVYYDGMFLDGCRF